MRPFWLQCLSVIGLICLYHSVPSKGLTLKIKLAKGVVLKITLEGKKKKNQTEPEEEKDIDMVYTDNEQWLKLRQNMIGNSPEENIDNETSLFDQIVIVNAFARSKANDNKFLYQGDILMNINDDVRPEQQKRRKRAVVAFEYLRWQRDQGVPYKLHESLDDASRRVILSAIREWEQSLPCLKWRVKNDDDVDFVHFFKGEGCYSQVGRIGGEQSLSIGRGCEVHGIVLHEMGHVLGIFHEQSRPDRDNYVNIIKENILEGFETQFEKFNEDFIDSYNVDYDYASIMHYSPTAFAKQRGLVTIEPRPKRDVIFGQRDHLSNGDIRQANAMYGCDETDFIATTVSRTSTQTTQSPTTTSTSTKRTNPSTPEPDTDESATPPEYVTTMDLTTEPVTTTNSFTTPPRVTTTEPVTTPELATTAEPGITIEPVTKPELVTTREPTTQLRTEKSGVCVDLLSTCYKWIRKGYCSPSSPNYCHMKYFCRKTCEIWKNSELSKGATCVDLLPDCEVKAFAGECTNLNEREYMENMCCESCRVHNCKDDDRFCAVWASSGACATFSYVQKNCQESCNLCDI